MIPRADDGEFNSVYAHKVMRKAPCPVWVGNSLELKAIAVCVDPEGIEGSKLELNIKSLEMGTSLAVMEGASLHVVSAWSPFVVGGMHRHMSKDEIEAYVGSTKKSVENSLEKILTKFMGEACQMEVHLEMGPLSMSYPKRSRN